MQAKSSIPASIDTVPVNPEDTAPVDSTGDVNVDTIPGGSFKLPSDGQSHLTYESIPHSIKQYDDQHVEKLKWSYERLLDGTNHLVNFGCNLPTKFHILR